MPATNLVIRRRGDHLLVSTFAQLQRLRGNLSSCAADQCRACVNLQINTLMMSGWRHREQVLGSHQTRSLVWVSKMTATCSSTDAGSTQLPFQL